MCIKPDKNGTSASHNSRWRVSICNNPLYNIIIDLEDKLNFKVLFIASCNH